MMCSRSRGSLVWPERSHQKARQGYCGDLQATARTSSFTLDDVDAMVGC